MLLARIQILFQRVCPRRSVIQAGMEAEGNGSFEYFRSKVGWLFPWEPYTSREVRQKVSPGEVGSWDWNPDLTSATTHLPKHRAGTGSEGLKVCWPLGQGLQLPVLRVGQWQGREAQKGKGTSQGTGVQFLRLTSLWWLSKPLTAAPSEDGS